MFLNDCFRTIDNFFNNDPFYHGCGSDDVHEIVYVVLVIWIDSLSGENLDENKDIWKYYE